MLPAVRVEGGVSYYCVQADYCQSPLWQNQNYHPIHSWQLDTLARTHRRRAIHDRGPSCCAHDWAPIVPFSVAPRMAPLPLRAAPARTAAAPQDQAPDLGTW